LIGLAGTFPQFTGQTGCVRRRVAKPRQRAGQKDSLTVARKITQKEIIC